MKRAFLVSVGVHLGMVVLLILPALYLGRRVSAITAHQVVMVELPPAPEPAPPSPPPPAAPVVVPPPPKHQSKPLPPLRHAVTKPALPPPKPTIPRAEPEAPSHPTVSPPIPSPVTPTVGTPVVRPKIDAPEFDCSTYCPGFQRKVESQWSPPPEPTQGSAPAVVVFTIHRDGSVDGVEIETRSGNFYFDQAALRAVLQAAPLPPLPYSFADPTLRVHLSFTVDAAP
jgi:protein TonB